MQSKITLETRLERPVERSAIRPTCSASGSAGFVADAGYRLAVSCEPGVNRLSEMVPAPLPRKRIEPYGY